MFSFHASPNNTHLEARCILATRVEYYYKNSQHRNQNIDYDMMGLFHFLVQQSELKKWGRLDI